MSDIPYNFLLIYRAIPFAQYRINKLFRFVWKVLVIVCTATFGSHPCHLDYELCDKCDISKLYKVRSQSVLPVKLVDLAHKEDFLLG